MSFSDTLICLGVLFVPFGILMALRIRANMIWKKEYPSEIAAWKQFAQEHKLKFNSGNFINSNVMVSGLYRDYYVEFFTKTEHEDRDQRETYTFTNIRLSIRHRNINVHRESIPKINDDEITKQEVVDLLIPNGLVLSRGYYEITIDSDQIHYRYRKFEGDKEYLIGAIDMFCDLADNYPGVVGLGGIVVPALEELANQQGHTLSPIANFLLEAIASRSRDLRISYPNLLCPSCFYRFQTQKVKLSRWKSPSYYACPQCHQNRDYFVGKKVVAVLNSQMEQEYLEVKNTLRVNWCHHRQVFDFDTVVIEKATDEDVERFAVQIGNHTDETRKSRYSKVPCTIAPDCELSENTMRILQHTFGNVEIMTSAGVQL